MNRRFVFVLVLGLALLTLCGGSVFAQDHTPKEYSPDEFARWMKDLYRGEAITIGSYPLTLFLTLGGLRLLPVSHAAGTERAAVQPELRPMALRHGDCRRLLGVGDSLAGRFGPRVVRRHRRYRLSHWPYQ